METRKAQERSIATKFAQLMIHGKVSEATSLINRHSGGLLNVDETVIGQLKEKHSSASTAAEEILITSDKMAVE